MTNKEIEQITAIMELILGVGVPSAIRLIQQFSTTDNPSPEEIRSLSEQLKPGNEYFD